MKAIVVDDCRAVRRAIRSSLAQKGFDVVEAEDGRQALDELRLHGPFDLALVDWKMPAMSGYDLILEVRKDAQMDAMSIMMVTAQTDLVDVQAALGAGADEYIMKPFTEEAFRDKLVLLGFCDP
jgi:two-component system chemotaxis response regulator CheY